MKTISPIELQQILTMQPEVPLLDVRTPVEYEEVHVALACNIPLSELNPAQLAEAGTIAKDQPVYLLCRSGQRATRAADQLAAAGFLQPIVVTGGTLAWIESNLPVVRGARKVISLERQVRIAAGSLVLTGVVLGWLVHWGFFGLSAFVGGGLVCAGITDFCGMGLLLARMPWNKR